MDSLLGGASLFNAPDSMGYSNPYVIPTPIQERAPQPVAGYPPSSMAGGVPPSVNRPQPAMQPPQIFPTQHQLPQQFTPPMAAQGAAPPDTGVITRMLGKRREYLKLVTLAVMIVLALAIHSLVVYFIDRLKVPGSENLLIGCKMLYVMSAIIILWVLKAYN